MSFKFWAKYRNHSYRRCSGLMICRSFSHIHSVSAIEGWDLEVVEQERQDMHPLQHTLPKHPTASPVKISRWEQVFEVY